jgi:RNA recognition motif-containing protein
VFPDLSAAKDFLQATGGILRIGGRVFNVKVTDPQQEARKGETPTDTLVVRGIDDMTERQLGQAFAHLTPRLKKVKTQTDKAGKSKGFGWVTFETIEEADLVLQRLKKEGSSLAGRRVTVRFHEPSTIEGMTELERQKKRSLESIEASHAQALAGPNSDMWASYIAMFQQPQSKEPSPKVAKVEFDNATVTATLPAVQVEDFPGSMGAMGGGMQPQFTIPTSGGGGSWLGLNVN